MRILQIANKVPYPPKDGGAIAILNLAQAFSSKGHDVTVLAMNTLKHRSGIDEIPSELTKIIQFIYVPVDTNIRIDKLLFNFLFSKLPYTASRFLQFDFSVRLTELLKKQEFDIIQLEGLYLTPYIHLIRKHSKAPVAYRAHNIEHEIWNRIYKNTRNPFKRIYLQNLAKRIAKMEVKALKSCDLLVPITERDLKKLNHFVKHKPAWVTPTGIPEAKFRADTTVNKASRIFYLGSLDWIPNQEGLVWFIDKVWDRLKLHSDFEFNIAGRNAPEWLTKKIIASGAIFHGEIESAAQFFDNNDVMVVPLFAGSGMRIKIIEAMARSKAIVTTTIGAEGLGASPSQHLLLADNEEEMISAIHHILENIKFFTTLKQNAYALAKEKFSNEIIADGLIKFYNQHITA